MTHGERHYPILDYTIKSAVQLYAVPLSPVYEGPASDATTVYLHEIPPRVGRDLSRRNPRQYLRAYQKRGSVLYGDPSQVKIAYHNRKLIVEKGVLAQPAYQLALLKTVIPAIGTLDRRCYLHASSVAFGENAILIFGPSGYGKSTLATCLEFLGAEHLCDDIAPLSRFDDDIKLISSRVGRMLLPGIIKSLSRELAILRLDLGYEVNGKTWYPSFRPPRFFSYRPVGVVVLGGRGADGQSQAFDTPSQEAALKTLLQSIFGQFDFSTHLAQTYLPIFSELIRQTQWNYFERPESLESFMELAERIAERFNR